MAVLGGLCTACSRRGKRTLRLFHKERKMWGNSLSTDLLAMEAKESRPEALPGVRQSTARPPGPLPHFDQYPRQLSQTPGALCRQGRKPAKAAHQADPQPVPRNRAPLKHGKHPPPSSWPGVCPSSIKLGSVCSCLQEPGRSWSLLNKLLRHQPGLKLSGRG